MNEQKPRPEYGEYATPQDQARAMGKSYGDTGLTGPAEHAEHKESKAREAKPARETPARDTKPARPAVKAEPEHPTRTWDVVLTSAFLVAGVLFVLSMIPAFADLYDGLNQAAAQLGYGAYTSRELAEGVGVALNLSMVAILIATIVFSVRALRAGRLAFYIPLIGGLLTVIVIFALLLVATLGDPGLMESIQP